MFVNGSEKIALVTDTSCDLSDELLARYDIRTVSLRITCSTGDYRDRLEISQEQLYEILSHEVPRTSLPLPEDISQCFRQLAEEGCTHILYLSISSGLSGSWNMVNLLAEDFDDIAITVYDSKTLSCGLGLLVLEAVDCLKQGMSVADTIIRLNDIREQQLGTFVIRTLEFLRKGGRIGLVEGMLGSLLQLKPVIQVNPEGVYQTLAKARGYNGAVSTLCEEYFKRYRGQRIRLAIVHGNAPDEAERVMAKFKEHLDVEYAIISPVSPALAIHTGPGLVGAIAQPID